MFWEFPIYNIKDLIGAIADFVGILGIVVGGVIIYNKITIIIKKIAIIINSFTSNSFTFNLYTSSDVDAPNKDYKNIVGDFPSDKKHNIAENIIIKDNKGVINFNN